MAAIEKMRKEPQKLTFKSIGVFGGSNLGKDNQFLAAAHELGKALGTRKINMVYGGGTYGIKASAAATTLIEGNHVLGILLQNSSGMCTPSSSLGMETKVSNMYDRFACMLYNSDAFIALPGGVETLEGIACVAVEAKVNFGMKPIGLLNVDGFYDDLLCFLDHAVRQYFISPQVRRRIVSASNADQLINLMQKCPSLPNPVVIQENGQQLPDNPRKRKIDTVLRL